MARKKMLWQLYPSYLVIIILAIFALAWFALWSQKKFYLEQTASNLNIRALMLENQFAELVLSEHYRAVDSLCKEVGTKINTRFTVILPDGAVVGDTEKDPARMENHRTRPEIAEALEGQTGLSIRFSNTLQINLMYHAIPLQRDGRELGVIRTSVPITFIDDTLSDIRTKMALGGLVIALLASLTCLLISRRITRPLQHLKHGAERFSKGHFTHKLLVPDTEEIGSLAEAMNEMAAELNERISTITRQRTEQEAILLSMAEGVLAVDRDERIININKTAAEFFNVNPGEITKRILHEVIRNTALQQLVNRIFEEKEMVEATIILVGEAQRFLQATGSILRDAAGEAIGAVVVLNDVTRIRELENLRRDFVANVSHELRTPITSIQGFVETLQDGALKNPEDAERFLKIIAKHVDRLNSIIEDLLSLSRIEQAPDITFTSGRLVDAVKSAVEDCETAARAKNISLKITGDEQLKFKFNRTLLEQALVNLLDNAIKVSKENDTVLISFKKDEKEVQLNVEDHGPGIPEKHQSRIFERFYRVDKARSREMGGTGLGLSIVKHIALAHSGRVSLKSKVGEGSTFTLHIPLK